MMARLWRSAAAARCESCGQQKIDALRRGLLAVLVACCFCFGGSSVARADAPTLIGLDPNKPMILPITVQAAYNSDTMFFNIEWNGDRGDTHQYYRYTNGAWRPEGSPRREAQSTLDNDPARGPTNRTSTSYESRVAFMLNDPNGPNAVPKFAQYGCAMTCHDDSRAMPKWDPATDKTKYLTNVTQGSLDLWHHRLARGNPIGLSDDQHVTRIPPGGTAGGRLGDAGKAPFRSNRLINGKPEFLLDPATSGGEYAFQWENLHESPNRFFRDPSALERGAGPVSATVSYAAAEAAGYVPKEGDTVSAIVLQESSASHGDITAFGSKYTPSASDPLFGRIESNTQRLLNTGNSDDVALADGGVFDIAFAVHTGLVTVRDHYTSFPLKISLGGGPGNLVAVKLLGSGRDTLPDFGDLTQFPETNISLFLPGITSEDFLTNQNLGLTYIDPATGRPVNQRHGGASALQAGATCMDCHTAARNDPFLGQFDFAGAMEDLVSLRGGVNGPTPLVPEPVTLALLASAASLGGLAIWARRRRR